MAELEHFIVRGYPQGRIAEMFRVSVSTVKRRVREMKSTNPALPTLRRGRPKILVGRSATPVIENL